MRLSGVLVLVLGFAGCCGAQVIVSGDSGGPATVGGVPTTVVLPSWSPYLATPTASFTNYSSSPVGARTATANNIAGASTTTLGNIPPSGAASECVLVYHNPSPAVEGLPYAPRDSGEVSQELPPGDRSGIGAYFAETPAEPTLTEAAAAARKKSGTAAHLYTNEDIAALPSGGLPLPPASTNPFAAPFTSATVSEEGR